MNRVSRVWLGSVLGLLTFLVLQPAALAASRSVTVTVSCEIVPIMALAAKSSVQTNGATDYSVTEALVQTTQGNVKQYSMTAL